MPKLFYFKVNHRLILFKHILNLHADKADADRATSEAEMRELERQISHDRKLRQFMKLKSQERQEDEELLTYRKRKGLILCRHEILIERYVLICFNRS